MKSSQAQTPAVSRQRSDASAIAPASFSNPGAPRPSWLPFFAPVGTVRGVSCMTSLTRVG